MSNDSTSLIRRVPKDEYARRIGVSGSVLRNMLNIEFFEELQKAGYKKHQKYLTVTQIEVLERKAVNLHL